MSPKPGLQEAIDQFDTFLRVEKNLSPRTRRAYAYDLGRFADWLTEKFGKPPAPSSIQPGQIQDYLGFLRGALQYKANTLSRVVASIRVFFEFCVEQGIVSTSPARDLARPKLPRKLPIYLTRQEVRKLFDTPDTSNAQGLRDLAILVTLAYTGVRLQELVGLNTIDLDFSRKTIRVLGKGRKERLVPMNPVVELALQSMLEHPERHPSHGEKAVFLNRNGKRLSGRSVQYVVDRNVKAAGITKEKVSPHKLRHTFATMLHSNEVDLVDIQALLGHASIASTQIYTHTDSGRLQSAIDRLKIEI